MFSELAPQRTAPAAIWHFGRKSGFSIWIIHHLFDPSLKCHHNNASELASVSFFLQPCGWGWGCLDNNHHICCSRQKNSFSVKVPLFSRHHNHFFFNCKVRKVTRILSYHNTDLRCLLSGCKAVWRIKFEVLPTLALAGMSNGCTTLVTIETSDAFAQHAACPQVCQNETAAFINMADILLLIYAWNLKLHLGLKFNSFSAAFLLLFVKKSMCVLSQLYKVEMRKAKRIIHTLSQNTAWHLSFCVMFLGHSMKIVLIWLFLDPRPRLSSCLPGIW